MNKYIDENELDEIELKPGMIVQLKRCKDNTIHNMVIIPIGNSLGAIESIMSHETPTFSKITFDNWCFIDKEIFSKTLGIESTFGDKLIGTFPHLGIGYNDEEYIIFTHKENGQTLINY